MARVIIDHEGEIRAHNGKTREKLIQSVMEDHGIERREAEAAIAVVMRNKYKRDLGGTLGMVFRTMKRLGILHGKNHR